ncbi:MAG: LacI family DNA-binding transcriptional regulator [Anaerolineaceae bacterium]|jgi:DNA-binding LacI/PurR family transcriptional regulator
MRPKQLNDVKLNDIARSSGVSLSTVSLVLNNKPGVSETTRTLVMNTAASLGYKPRLAKSFNGQNRLRSLGLIMRAEPDDCEKGKSNEFYSHIISGIENACREKHITLLLTSVLVESHYNYPVEIPRLLEENRADGYLLVGIHVNQLMDMALQESNLATVLVDAYPNLHPYDSVLTANKEGCYNSIKYLIERGHRKIGFIGGWDGAYPSFEERRAGYRQCLADHHIADCYFANTTTRRADVLRATHELMSTHRDLTALVGVNDDVAIGAINALLEMGLRVPDDISVIGFDDILAAVTMNPPLTTMMIDKTNMGYLAVELLAFRKHKPEANPVAISIHPRLLERNTVKNRV